jgi:hypothetical protein
VDAGPPPELVLLVTSNRELREAIPFLRAIAEQPGDSLRRPMFAERGRAALPDGP